MSRTENIAVLLPTRGTRHNGLELVTLARAFPHAVFLEGSSSAVVALFNGLLAQALDLRDRGLVTHALMLHDDIKIGDECPAWPSLLLDVYAESKADVLSAAVSFRDDSGSTSTALETGNLWHPQVLTAESLLVQQKMAQGFGQGDGRSWFTHPGLLVNSGLLFWDMRREWCKGDAHPWFRFENAVRLKGGPGGQREIVMQPEDWSFSRDAARRGARLAVTTAIPTIHVGQKGYRCSHA